MKVPEPGRASGQALALFAITFAALLLTAGLVIDGSYAWVQSRGAQNGADMAALAGARIVHMGRTGAFDDGDVAAAIVDLAAANETDVITGWGTDDGPMYTSWNGEPMAGAHVGSGCTTQLCAIASSASIPTGARGVVVGASRAWTPFFLGLIGITDWTARADAVARASITSGGGGPCAICLLELGTAGAAAAKLTANGSILINTVAADAAWSDITADGGSIEVDGIAGDAATIDLTAYDGSIRISGSLIGLVGSTFQAASGSIEIGGDLLLAGSSHASASSISVDDSITLLLGSTVTPTPTDDGPVSVTITDPFASLAQPTHPDPLAIPKIDNCIDSCSMTIVPAAGRIHTVNVIDDSTVTLYPGLYGLVDLTLGSTAYLHPGTYYFAGLTGGAVADLTSRFEALGPVTLAFLDQTHLAIASGSGLRIGAPDAEQPPTSTYPWPGIAVLAARDNINTFTLANDATYPLDGSIYGPDLVLTTAAFSDVHVAGHVVVGTYLSAADASLTVTLSDPPATGTVQLVR